MKQSLDARRQDPPVVQACYQICIAIQKLTAEFPRRQKYLLGEVLASTALELLTGLAKACATANLDHKVAQLSRVSGLLLPIRLQLRMARDLDCLSDGQYVDLCMGLDDLQSQTKALIHWAETSESSTGGGESRRGYPKQNQVMRDLPKQ
jgi:hypothetical protein